MWHSLKKIRLTEIRVIRHCIITPIAIFSVRESKLDINSSGVILPCPGSKR